MLKGGERLEVRRVHPRHRPQPRFFSFELYVGDRKIDVRRIENLRAAGRRDPELLPSHGLVALGLDATVGAGHGSGGRNHASCASAVTAR